MRYKVVAQANRLSCVSSTQVGLPHLPIGPGDTCPSGYRVYQQDSYMWGFTTDTDNDNLWFGTWTHGLCENLTTYNPLFQQTGLGVAGPFNTPEAMCEFQDAFVAKQDPSIGSLGDGAPPKEYEYEIKTGKLIDRTPSDPEFAKMSGIRTCGYERNVVFCAGIESSPLAGATGGTPTHMFAWNAKTGAYLGEHAFPVWGNPKVYWAVDGQLYAGFNRAKPDPPCCGNSGPTWGEVAKWTGDVQHPFTLANGDSAWPVVGRTENQVTYLYGFEGRIVASEWASDPNFKTRVASGLAVSPPVPPGGLTPADADNWHAILHTTDIYPAREEAIAANFAGMGDLGGWLYVGMDNAPEAFALIEMDCPRSVNFNSPLDILNFYLRSDNTAAVFRIKNVGSAHPIVQLLYGRYKYYTWDCPTKKWVLKVNPLHQKPLYGGPGFGNPVMYYAGPGVRKFRGALYFGTFDAGALLNRLAGDPNTNLIYSYFPGLNPQNLPPTVLRSASNLVWPNKANTAADVWVFDSANKPAHPVTVSGWGNNDSWETRDWFNIGDQSLFSGTEGGWDGFAPGTNPAAPVSARAAQAPTSGPPRRPGWDLVQLFPGTSNAWPLQLTINVVHNTAKVVTVHTDVRVDFRVTVTNVAQYSKTRGARVCVRLPKGFTLVAGLNPGVTKIGNQVCLPAGNLPPGASKTFVIHAISSGQPENVAVGAIASGNQLTVGHVHGLAAKRVSVRGAAKPPPPPPIVTGLARYNG
jgi:hypothetical protein